MLGDPITVTYDAVAKNLVKVKEENYSSTYFLSEALREYTLEVRHSIPSNRASTGESHSVKLTIVDYDADGVAVNNRSVWTNLKTFIGRQSSEADKTWEALVDFMTDANIDKIVARES